MFLSSYNFQIALICAQFSSHKYHHRHFSLINKAWIVFYPSFLLDYATTVVTQFKTSDQIKILIVCLSVAEVQFGPVFILSGETGN